MWKKLSKGLSEAYGKFDFIQDLVKDAAIGVGIGMLTNSVDAGLASGGIAAIADNYFYGYEHCYVKARQVYHGIKDLAVGVLAGKLAYDNAADNGIANAIYYGGLGFFGSLAARIISKEGDDKNG